MPIKKSAAPAAPIAIRSLEEVSPALVDLQARKVALSQSRNALSRERAQLVDHQYQRAPDGGLGARVEELLGDAVSPVPDKPTRIQEIDAELKAVDAALRVLDSRVSNEKRRASATICDEVAGAHRQLVADLVAGLSAAHRAHVEINALTDQLGAAGVSWEGRLGGLYVDRLLGTPRDNHGALAWLLNDAADAGLIEVSDIPDELRRGRGSPPLPSERPPVPKIAVVGLVDDPQEARRGR